MPFKPFKTPDKKEWCNYKVDADGNKVGESLGCHSSKKKAHRQIAAIEANMDEKSVKRDIPAQERRKDDFLYPKERSFPILKPADVSAAVNSFGRSKGKDFDDFKRRLIRMARRKGSAFVSALPDKWKEDMKKSTDVEIETIDNSEIVDLPDKISEVIDLPDEVTDTNEALEKSNNYCVKALGQNRIGSYAALWGDENKKDLVEEFFTPETDEMSTIFKAMTKLPWLFEHASDDTLKTSVIAEVDILEPDEIGLWYEAKIREHELYREYVKPLIQEKALYTSSGTLPGARQVKKSTGEILRWPIAELTGTVKPAEFRMLERPIDEIKTYYKSIGLDFMENETDDAEDDAKVTEGIEKMRLAAETEQSKLRLRLSNL